jgi:hypothetical protein
MSGIYVPGAFNKKKLTVEIPTVAHLEEKQIEQETPKEPKTPKPAKEVISEIKPVEVKQTAWGGKKSFIECLKTASSEPELKPKEEAVIVKTNSMPVYVQKEIRKEEYDAFMQKYDTKLRKLYEKSIYYDKEYLSKLRINGEQGYLKFCKFMFSVI